MTGTMTNVARAAVATAALAAPWAGGATAWAQDDSAATRLASMQVDLWPEYDDPRVLVIYKGELDPGLSVPRDVVFVIPPGAQIHMAGAISETGEHLHALYETRPRSDGLVDVTYRSPSPTVYVEFYYDPLGDGEKREFEYPLVSPVPVARWTVNVQEPRGAREFRTVPAAMSVAADADGLRYHQFVLQDVVPDTRTLVSVSYRKSGREPSVTRVDPNAPSGGTAMKNIAIIGAIVLVGVVGYGVFRGRLAHPVVAEARTGKSRVGVARSAGASGTHKYCTACGTRMRRTDAFCSECGAQAVPV